MKRGLILLIILATLAGIGCQGAVSTPPAQGFFLDVIEPTVVNAASVAALLLRLR